MWAAIGLGAGGVGTDVTAGKSKSDGLCREGWPAVEGFDCCSGLGTPVYPKLLAAAMQAAVSTVATSAEDAFTDLEALELEYSRDRHR